MSDRKPPHLHAVPGGPGPAGVAPGHPAMATPGRPVLVPVAVTGPGTSRPIGAFEVGPERVRFHPVLDLRSVTMAVAGLGALAVAAVGVAALRSGRPAVGPVTMGPGGWLSVRNAAPARARTGRRLGVRNS